MWSFFSYIHHLHSFLHDSLVAESTWHAAAVEALENVLSYIKTYSSGRKKAAKNIVKKNDEEWMKMAVNI